MSLMRLLEANRSVGAAVDDSHRYKLQKNFLPKFSPVARPVSLAPGKQENKKVTMETPSLFEQAKSPVTASASALTEVPAVLSVGVFQKAETEQASASLEPVKASWFSRVKQIFSRKKAATAAVRPVQTEWTLDRVKVVRNDLSDCDLDVVVAGLQAEPARAKGKSLVGRAWKKVEVPVEKLQPAETLK